MAPTTVTSEDLAVMAAQLMAVCAALCQRMAGIEQAVGRLGTAANEAVAVLGLRVEACEQRLAAVEGRG